MKNFDFSVIIDAYSVDDVAQSVWDAVYEAGCDDALISSSEGVTSLSFHREAATEDEAIASAISDFASGLRAGKSNHCVTRVEADDDLVTDEMLHAIERANATLSATRASLAYRGEGQSAG